MNRKRNVGLCILLAILLVGGMAGSDFLLHNPPLGSEFTMWEPIPEYYEDVKTVGVLISRKYTYTDRDESSGEWVLDQQFEIVNLRKEELSYEPRYRYDYFHWGKWYTVCQVGPTLAGGQPDHSVPAQDSVLETVRLPQAIGNFPGRYRCYLEGIGSFEFYVMESYYR